MPHSKNDALLGLNERAERAAAEGDTKDISRHVLRFLDNPHIEADEKRKMIDRWAALGEDILRMRSEGEFITDSILVYPNFNLSVHGMQMSELPKGFVPKEWSRYAVIDPGHAVTAVLFAAVPPDESMILIYDELYLRQANAILFAEGFAEKVKGYRFQAYLIDAHGARLTDIGSGRSPQQQYTEQLAIHNCPSVMTGHSFIAGSDDILAGLEATRRYMHIRPDGKPRLRVLHEFVPNFVREIKRYKKQTMQVSGTTIVTDNPNKRGEHHLMDCLRYLCSYEPRYHEPPAEMPEQPWWVEWQKRKQSRSQQDSVVHLSPRSYTEVFYA